MAPASTLRDALIQRTSLDVEALGQALRKHETTVRPLVGIFPEYDSLGARVSGLSPGGAAADGGVREGDYLLRAGPVELGEPDDFNEFRAHFSNLPEGTTYEVVVRRGDEEVTLELELRLSEDSQYTLVEDPDASPEAVRIRDSTSAPGLPLYAMTA